MRRDWRRGSKIWAMALSAGLACPAIAVAAPGDSRPASSAAGPASMRQADDPVETVKAKSLYRQGKAAFDTTDYQTAIDAWTEAYRVLPDTPTNAPVKAALIYNLATAQERAFGIDEDLIHLRRAADLMQSYSESIPALYSKGPEAQAETDKINERLAEVQAKIDEVEAGRAAKAEADRDARAAAATARNQPGPTQDAPPPDPKARVFVVTGAALIGVGIAGLGVMAGGLVIGSQADSDVPENLPDRRDQFDRGRAGNAMAYAGAAIGGTFAIAGAVLLGLGLTRQRTSVAVNAAPGQAGLVVRGRF